MVNVRKGFTLLEIVVVMIMLGVGVTLLARVLTSAATPTGQALARSNLERVVVQQMAHAQSTGEYSLDDGVPNRKGLTFLYADAASTTPSELSVGVTLAGSLVVAVQGPSGCVAARVTRLDAGAERLDVELDDAQSCAAVSVVAEDDTLILDVVQG